MSSNKKYDVMICLVGENPLPVFLGIKQFTHPQSKVVLVHSDSDLSKAATAGITKSVPARTITPYSLEDPYSPIKVAKDMQQIETDYILPSLLASESVALNYTGGTKVMSSISFRHFLDTNKNNVDLFYLEEGGGPDFHGVFHFGLENEPAELGVELSLSELCSLHQVNPKKRRKIRQMLDKRPAEPMACSVCQQIE